MEIAAAIQAIATVVLVVITAIYAWHTRKLADAAQSQIEQSRAELEQLRRQAKVAETQMKLEYDPNLHLTGEVSSDGMTATFRLVNLGRYALWIDGVKSTGFSSAGVMQLLGIGVGSVDDRRVLHPGQVVRVKVFEGSPLLNPEGRSAGGIPHNRVPSFVAVFQVRFAYGSTGPWIHIREWKVTLQDDVVKRVYIQQIGQEPEPIPY